jgi:hypothetical protein
MAVDAVGATFSVPSSNHLIETLSIGERGVLDLGVGLDPVEPLAVLAPERFRIRGPTGKAAFNSRCVSCQSTSVSKSIRADARHRLMRWVRRDLRKAR